MPFPMAVVEPVESETDRRWRRRQELQAEVDAEGLDGDAAVAEARRRWKQEFEGGQSAATSQDGAA